MKYIVEVEDNDRDCSIDIKLILEQYLTNRQEKVKVEVLKWKATSYSIPWKSVLSAMSNLSIGQILISTWEKFIMKKYMETRRNNNHIWAVQVCQPCPYQAKVVGFNSLAFHQSNFEGDSLIVLLGFEINKVFKGCVLWKR